MELVGISLALFSHPRLSALKLVIWMDPGSPVSLLGQIPGWVDSGVSQCTFVVSGHVLTMLLVGVLFDRKGTQSFWPVCHNSSYYRIRNYALVVDPKASSSMSLYPLYSTKV